MPQWIPGLDKLWRQTSPQRIPCNSKLAHKGRKDTNPLPRIFLGRGFAYIAYLSNLRYHRITKQSGGCYNGKIHNGRTHRTYELVGDYYLVAGDEGPDLEPIGIYGQRHRRYLSLQRISEVLCSFVGVTFAFLFVESRVFSPFTPCGAAGAPRLLARYCGQRGLSDGWQG